MTLEIPVSGFRVFYDCLVASRWTQAIRVFRHYVDRQTALLSYILYTEEINK